MSLGGCAGLTPSDRAAPVAGAAHAPAGAPIAPAAALDAITIGTSTRAEVAMALGPAIVVAFASGYEVWVYRWPGADATTRAATELVVLFDPSGRAKKVRLRPGYRASDTLDPTRTPPRSD